MLNGVSDVLTPWTALRILQIMEAASAFRNAGGSAPHGGGSADGGADMELLLRLANQLPDVAGRVMTAPLFAQRPLVESYNGDSASLTMEAFDTSSDGASSMSITYEDARHMCMAALAARRGMWDGEPWNSSASSTHEAKLHCSPAHTAPQTAAAELEEVGFAAEFLEPCLRGSFPDVAAALRHVLPEVGGGLSLGSDAADAQSAIQRGTPDMFHGALSSISRPPPIPPAAPLANGTPSPSAIDDGAPTTSLRLHLAQKLHSAASATPRSLVLETIPPPSLLPIAARGPPGHPMFDGGCVAYTFSTAEREELLASLRTGPPPLHVFGKEEVAAHCRPGGQSRHQASTPLPPGAGPAAAATMHFPRSSFASTAARGAPGSGITDDDGWSASSGWSSRSSSRPRINVDGGKAAEEAPRDMLAVDAVNSESRPGSRAVAPAVDGPTSEVALETPSRGTNGNTRTWVDDDADLVLENGRITIRKKKMRLAKNLLATLPMPTVVSGPLVNPSLMTAVANATSAEERYFTFSALDGADCVHKTADGTIADEVPHEKKRTAGAKRSRDAMTASAPPDSHFTTPSSESLKTATTASSVTEAKRSTAAAATLSEAGVASTPIDTKRVPRLSQEEMLEFIEGLCVSDTLRRALLVGVVTSAVTEATVVNSPDTAGEGQSETDKRDGAH
ncbi:hypothetical protein LSCM1_02546 [Leishmania martiniquensis]|uniref:Uncharacterized protein n=1 Tax=Leishmania martiniquensis TaxID=1580590 RepID=A0A836H1V5_9TRYP|nr:hypothetical protein LSCM1_02546 [Leishmania martiniquensis]